MYVLFKNKINKLSFKIKLSILLFIDLLIFIISHIFSNFIREETFWYYQVNYKFILSFSLILTLATLFYFDVYKNFLRYTNLKLFLRIFYSVLLNSIIFLIFLFYFNFYNFPRSIGLIQPFVFFFLLIFSRILLKNFYLNNFSLNKNNIIIYGAGSAGISSVEILDKYNVIALVDDDSNKIGRKYGKIPIIAFKDIGYYIERYKVNKLFTALPNLNILSHRDLVNKLKIFPVQILNLPNIKQISSNSISYIDFENVITNELLARNIYDYNKINKSFFDNKNILVTGGGGSIGSEICLQLIDSNFKSLSILDHSEINIYNIKKLIEGYVGNKKNNINYYVCSIQHKSVIENILKDNRINIIFHAAAYKHVDLVENNINTAIINNIIGTDVLCQLAHRNNVDNFILISSDKAVKPTNIMGATKRIAEKINYYYSINSNTIFSTVRFGNVINSSGSVIPIFKNQIKNNQKLTVTSKEVERYFMTISEAVALVLESCILSKGGETFFLNMGKRIKIYDLAKKMLIISSNSNTKENINFDEKIKIIGLKKGEKLFEELSIDEKIYKSINKNIFIDPYNLKINIMNPNNFIKDFIYYSDKNDEKNLVKLLEDNVEDFKFY